MSLDAIDWQILLALQTEARQSFTALGRRVGLSTPAVTERVRKLETAGVIEGYTTRVSFAALAIAIQAFVQLTTTPQVYPQVHRLVRETPAFLECHHLTGDASFLIRVVARSLPHLETLLQQLSEYGTTKTSLVLSTPLPFKPISPSIHG
jgi:Lrp/AsnC family leucine-responsive transcriptional regulator